jgi:hypothetical protein
MKVSSFATTFLLVILFNIIGCMKAQYVNFHPVKLEEDSFVVDKSKGMSDQFKQNIQQVFIYYDVDYRVSKKGNIEVPEEQWEDKELMWNYTTKANDQEWLKGHPIR